MCSVHFLGEADECGQKHVLGQPETLDNSDFCFIISLFVQLFL